MLRMLDPSLVLDFLTDSLSLRFDADATLGLDGKQEMRYTLTGGVQWSF